MLILLFQVAPYLRLAPPPPRSALNLLRREIGEKKGRGGEGEEGARKQSWGWSSHSVVDTARFLGKTPLTINLLIGDRLIASNYPKSCARVFRKNVGKNNRERVGEEVTTRGERCRFGYRTFSPNRLGADLSGGLKPGDWTQVCLREWRKLTEKYISTESQIKMINCNIAILKNWEINVIP